MAEPGPRSNTGGEADLQRENALLRQELDRRNRELAEAKAREAATAEILRSIAGSPAELQRILDTLVASVAQLCDAPGAGLQQLVDGRLRRVATFRRVADTSAGAIDRDREFRERGEYPSVPATRGSVPGRALAERRTVALDDMDAAARAEFPASAEVQAKGGYRSTVATPLLSQGEPIGVFVLVRYEVRPFTERQIELLESFANQAVIAIANARLFQELQDRNRDLAEALEQQTATSEILRVIAGSPAELQPVLDAVADNAAALCDAEKVLVLRVEGAQL